MIMKHKGKALLAATVGLGLLGGLSSAYAADASRVNPMTSLASVIAAKFNLNASDVEQVMKDEMASHRAAMEAKHASDEASRLAQAVSDGKLTQAQADAITAHEASAKASFEALRGKTGEELTNALEALKESEKQWAEDNDIPAEFLQHGFGHFGPRGPNKK